MRRGRLCPPPKPGRGIRPSSCQTDGDTTPSVHIARNRAKQIRANAERCAYPASSTTGSGAEYAFGCCSHFPGHRLPGCHSHCRFPDCRRLLGNSLFGCRFFRHDFLGCHFLHCRFLGCCCRLLGNSLFGCRFFRHGFLGCHFLHCRFLGCCRLLGCGGFRRRLPGGRFLGCGACCFGFCCSHFHSLKDYLTQPRHCIACNHCTPKRLSLPYHETVNNVWWSHSTHD
jgi:hypothetical protein